MTRALMPETLKPIAEVIGDAKAWALMDATHARAAQNGHKVKRDRPHRAFLYVGRDEAAPWIVDAIGERAAAQLVARFGNEVIDMPSGGKAARDLRTELARVLLFRAALPDSVVAAALGLERQRVRLIAEGEYEPARLGILLLGSDQ